MSEEHDLWGAAGRRVRWPVNFWVKVNWMIQATGVK
jgi:hypothetical protein